MQSRTESACACSSRSTHPWINPAIAFVLFQVIASGEPSFAADFSDANLSRSHLTNVDFRGTNLSGANLTGADLSGSDFRETNITQSQLDSACGYGTKLPAGLRIQPCSLREVQLQMQRSQQPTARENVSSSSHVDVSTGAERQ